MDQFQKNPQLLTKELCLHKPKSIESTFWRKYFFLEIAVFKNSAPPPPSTKSYFLFLSKFLRYGTVLGGIDSGL